jgi:hypothetical protein
VHDLGATSGPLETLHGHVDVSAWPKPPTAPLLGVLVWAAVPAVNPVCLLHPDDARIAAACPDPFGVFLGATETWAAVDADGNFDLPLAHLPDAGNTVGDSSVRLAYGTLLVMEDLDGDRAPTLVPPPNGEDGNLTFSTVHPDRVGAASFYHLRAPQKRVVYREGSGALGSYFYSAPGCDPPRDGFWIMTAAPYVDANTSAGPCTYASTDERVEVPALGAAGDPITDPTALLCRSFQNDGTVRRAVGSPNAPSSGYQSACFGGNLLAAVYTHTRGICSLIRSYALEGCALNPDCPNPDWNDTTSPPSWWPCP